MPDLFDPLRDLGDLPVHPLPADEVRRRGDRMRRRRRAVQTLGAAAAVVLVAAGTTVGLELLDSESATPVSAPAPENGWLTEIPTHYALDRGYPMAEPPETSQLGPSQKFAPVADAGIEPCERTAYPSANPVDSVGTRFETPSQTLARELTIYPDATTAGTVLAEMAEAWRGCPTQELPDPPFTLTTTITKSMAGDEAWTVVEGAPGFPGFEVFIIVRVGNAVLINTVSTHATFEQADAVVAQQAEQVSSLVTDMCIFALDPCSPMDPPDVEPTIPPLPQELLLSVSALREATGISGWEDVGQREDPTLDCQGDWLRNVGATKGAFREWRAEGAEAATAVLQLPDRVESRGALHEISSWMDQCDDRLPGTRELTPVGDVQVTMVAGSETHLRLFSAAAGDGGVAWLDVQGVALVGKRVVVLSFAVQPSLGIEEEALSAYWLEAMRQAIDAAGPTEEPAGVDIPDDFPLLDGWPADDQAETPEMGLEGPNRTLEPPTIIRCGETYIPPAHVDELRAQWTNVEDSRFRTLTTYADADAAVAAVEGLVEFYGACTRGEEPDTAGNLSHYEVRPTQLGGQSFGLAHWFTYEGAPAIGLELHHVIRVGRAVLIVSAGNEGGKSGIDEQLAGQAQDAATVIAAMCLFTQAGC